MITQRISAAVGAAVLVVLGSATGAFAAYEAPTITLEVTPTSLPGGQSFSGTATSNQDCSSWEITFDGPTTEGAKNGSGTSIDFTYSTTEVEDVETGTVTAVCTYDDGTRATAAANLSRSVDVTVNPTGVAGPTDGGSTGAGGDYGLANTGGPNMWLAIGGATLTAIGAGAVIRSRRVAA
ncbi:hypothetical protein ABIE44_002619 [Marmoricola sp. OAE513]|uniref:hypothetical protein n=1 Tax=Marmoricola sp. OAE513 TaxID=2817894 RepID=UPI001AE93F39